MLLVLTTFPDVECAREIAGRLLDERLAACLSLLAPAESHYFWLGVREVAAEIPAMIKTSEEAYPRLEARLRELHPYEVPEIVAVPVVRGLEEYVSWVHARCLVVPE